LRRTPKLAIAAPPERRGLVDRKQSQILKNQSNDTAGKGKTGADENRQKLTRIETLDAATVADEAEECKLDALS
jgi:hypothetical protein